MWMLILCLLANISEASQCRIIGSTHMKQIKRIASSTFRLYAFLQHCARKRYSTFKLLQIAL